MGDDKQKTQTQTTQQAAPTAEETELNKLGLERARAAQEGTIEAQSQGLSLINALLTGQQLPGFLQQLPGGISSEAIGNQATSLAAKNLTGFQNIGLQDSGVAFRETAKDIGSNLLLPAQQFNLQNLGQLLNLAVGGQASVQQPILGQQSALSQNLAGLRSVSQTGSSTQRSSTSFFNSPFATAAAGGAAQPLGTEAFGKFLFA